MDHSANGFIGVPEKVVIRLHDETIKAFLDRCEHDTLDALLENVTAPLPSTLRVRRLGESTIQEIPIAETNAIFYVKDFDGDSERKDLRFYRGAPISHGVWIRLEFLDGEIMEGLVHNTIRFLVDPGFFVRPTDPNSNNRLVYVVKNWLKDLRILGLRNI